MTHRTQSPASIRTRRRAWLLILATIAWHGIGNAQQERPSATQEGHLLGEVRGTITVSAKAAARESHVRMQMLDRYASHKGHDEAPDTDSLRTSPHQLSETAAVYLESEELNRGSYPVPEARPALIQRGIQFHPQVLPVVVGTAVEFPNQDNLFHNVFSYSDAREFDLGRYPKGDSRFVMFSRPGVVRVYCDIHATMNATIIVLPHPYFATPKEDGSFVIPRVPAGKYTIVLWLERDVVERRPLEVKSGSSVDVSFSF